LLPFAPNQAGALWIGLLVTFLVAGDFRRPFARRNLLLLLLLLPALPQIDIMNWESRLGDPHTGWLLGAAFTALFTVTAFMVTWALAGALGCWTDRFSIHLPRRALMGLVCALLALNTVVVLARPPEDSGPYSSLGARRWLETGMLPYGDPLLRGPSSPGFGAAATYGPVLLLAHIPFQFLVGAEANHPRLNPKSRAYKNPPHAATKLTCLFFHLLGLWALYHIGNRLAGTETGLALVCLYCASPYVIGLGDDEFLIGGLAFVSHVAPVAMTLLTLLFVHRPFVAGLLLAGAAGILYYPAFFFPLLLGWYIGRRKGALQFATGFAVVGAALVLLVITFTGSIGEDGPVRLFLQSTLEHQEGIGPREYGASKFGFWGTHPSLAAVWQKPLIDSHSLLKPSFLAFASFCVFTFFLARGRSEAQLAFLVASVAAAVQLWKTHAGGTYVEWYYPFLLIGLFCQHPAAYDEVPEPGEVVPA
jgi:hypothetical protein